MSSNTELGGSTRRAALGIGFAILGAAAAASTALAKTARRRIPLAFSDPVWNREMAARIQADTNGTQVYGHCDGVVCGVRPGEAVKTILGFQVFSTIRVLRQSDGSYQRMTKEAIFYTDAASGGDPGRMG